MIQKATSLLNVQTWRTDECIMGPLSSRTSCMWQEDDVSPPTMSSRTWIPWTAMIWRRTHGHQRENCHTNSLTTGALHSSVSPLLTFSEQLLVLPWYFVLFFPERTYLTAESTRGIFMGSHKVLTLKAPALSVLPSPCARKVMSFVLTLCSPGWYCMWCCWVQSGGLTQHLKRKQEKDTG